jgi:biopolymer transport protein ExbD
MKTSKYESDYMSSPNVTPLVDVSLTLVIIFMVTAPLIMQAGIRILESKVGAKVGKHAVGENVCVTLKANGEIIINDKKVEWKNLGKEIKIALKESKDKLVAVTAEDNNLVDEVVRVLDISKQNGAKKLAILKKQRKKNKSLST